MIEIRKMVIDLQQFSFPEGSHRTFVCSSWGFLVITSIEYKTVALQVDFSIAVLALISLVVSGFWSKKALGGL